MVLQAYTIPFDANNTEVEWSVSNSNVLRFDASEKVDYSGINVGYFTIVGVGQTNVIATAKDGSNVSRSILLGYYVSSISMPNTQIDLYIGSTWQANPIIVPSIATNNDLDWTSWNTRVARVDENGKITAVSSGSATITVSPKLPKNNYNVNPISFTVNVLDIPISKADFILPSGTIAVEDEAFYNSAVKLVKLPEGITSIGRKAFADCRSLEGIYIPASCSVIAADAFEGDDNVIFYCQAGSYAERYSLQHTNIGCWIIP